MHCHFGLDNNRNGLPDLPNTFEYVHNLLPGACHQQRCDAIVPRFGITFDASHSIVLDPSSRRLDGVGLRASRETVRTVAALETRLSHRLCVTCAR